MPWPADEEVYPDERIDLDVEWPCPDDDGAGVLPKDEGMYEGMDGRDECHDLCPDLEMVFANPGVVGAYPDLLDEDIFPADGRL